MRKPKEEEDWIFSFFIFFFVDEEEDEEEKSGVTRLRRKRFSLAQPESFGETERDE